LLSNLLTMGVHGEGDYRKVPCTQDYISTF